MSSAKPLDIYHQRLNDGTIKHDPEQEKAVTALSRLYDDLCAAHKPSLAFWRKPDHALGVYMYGGVGRGKSMLMDLFTGALPAHIKARRVHFHEFMIEVHGFLHQAQKQGDDTNNALPRLAKKIAGEVHVLCFDEFHVTDIADAMILGRLFTAVFAQGVTVVATSNWAPDKLYDKGLQRDLFLPFIDLLKTKVETIHLDSPHDYRTSFDAQDGTYLTPLSAKTTLRADEIFASLTNGAATHSDTITIKGRKIVVEQATDTAARLTFSQLCEQPHGAEDYLALAGKYEWIFIENIPRLGYDRRNEAKRFMTLIDALYEAHTKVIFTAASAPESLYSGDDHAYEFERTISRLNEMQSALYLEA
ncbi:MAG: cell division protein ZapE [Alphaproteobacteria bacterium]|nr:cell division protein ZapE [Alphaproteobacteria bacterium]|tara:strand:- start:5341 stop:6423 length:1083 start_codon:yes stop_codon:yes gene_type:complete